MGKRPQRVQRHPKTAQEWFAAAVGCHPDQADAAETRCVAAVEYARCLPPHKLARLVHSSLNVGDEATALGAAAVAYERGDSPGMLAYGLRRGDRLDAVQRWADLTHGPEAVA